MALTEKYVSSLAGGAGTGTVGSPYTLDQMVTEIRSLAGIGGQGIRYNVKADGTYGPRGWLDIGGNGTGTNALPTHIRGYKTTIGDGYLGRSGTNGALITTNMPVIQFNNAGFNAGKWCIVESINFTGNNGNYMINLENSTNMFNCVCQNDTTNNYGGAFSAREGAIVWECDFLQTTGNNANNGVAAAFGQGSKFFSCRIINSSATACYGFIPERFCMLYGCLIKGNGGGTGIYQSANDRPFQVINCTITNWQDGILLTANTNWTNVIWGSMITDNTRYGVNAALVTDGNCIVIGPNRTRANTSGDVAAAANTDYANIGRYWPFVTGAGPDYINTATNDYNLLNTSPAHNQNVPKYSDFGAYGAQDPSGGGGTALFHPIKPFIIRAT